MHTLRCYEIPDMMRDALDRAVDPDTGELTEAGAAEIRALTAVAETAAMDLACHIREMELEAAAVDETIQAAIARSARLKKQVARWREYMLEALAVAGKSKIADPRITVALKNNPPSVEVFAADDIPDVYFRVIPEKREPDKKGIAIILKAGGAVPGCRMTVTQRVEIR